MIGFAIVLTIVGIWIFDKAEQRVRRAGTISKY